MVFCYLFLYVVMVLIYGKYLLGCCKIVNRYSGSCEIIIKL